MQNKLSRDSHVASLSRPRIEEWRVVPSSICFLGLPKPLRHSRGVALIRGVARICLGQPRRAPAELADLPGFLVVELLRAAGCRQAQESAGRPERPVVPGCKEVAAKEGGSDAGIVKGLPGPTQVRNHVKATHRIVGCIRNQLTAAHSCK